MKIRNPSSEIRILSDFGFRILIPHRQQIPLRQGWPYHGLGLFICPAVHCLLTHQLSNIDSWYADKGTEREAAYGCLRHGWHWQPGRFDLVDNTIAKHGASLCSGLQDGFQTRPTEKSGVGMGGGSPRPPALRKSWPSPGWCVLSLLSDSPHCPLTPFPQSHMFLEIFPSKIVAIGKPSCL